MKGEVGRGDGVLKGEDEEGEVGFEGGGGERRWGLKGR